MRLHIETSGKIEFAVELLDDIFPEMADLFTQHYEEIAGHKDKIKLAPDMFRYTEMEKLGKLLICTIREQGRLIGYSLYFVDTHIHYKHTLFAMNDILFLLPEYRKDGLALKLLAYCEVQMRRLGVDIAGIHMKTYASFDKLCELAQYDFTEKIYTKYIKE